jgi:predicted RNA-binding protein with PUA-like domain
MKKHWLMKTEPTTFSFDDLLRLGKTQWEGVRNYQARNFMRDDMRVGDQVLIYHSNTIPPGIAGIATVIREAYPDHFAQDPESKYFDPKATKDSPIWMMVDIAPVQKLPHFIPLNTLRTTPELSTMRVLQKGCRLSIQPVTDAEFLYITKLSQKP